MLATAAVSPGLSDSVQSLINNQDTNKLWRVPVPSRFADKTFGEMLPYFRDKFQALLVGLAAPPLAKFALVTLAAIPTSFLLGGLPRKPFRL